VLTEGNFLSSCGKFELNSEIDAPGIPVLSDQLLKDML
jgi:hypothetical protein